ILSEIRLCKQRIENAETLFLMARMDEAAFRRHLEDNEQQIARLQSEMSEGAQVRQMIELTATLLADMGSQWQEANNEDKQALAQTLFSEVVFDLDTHQITGFALKPWAEQFLQIRAAYDGAVSCLEGFPLPAERTMYTATGSASQNPDAGIKITPTTQITAKPPPQNTGRGTSCLSSQ
ncbi:MAG: hypothetical protein IT322_11235, partial [Anaerolineae bacterium]|nr:hypothetical protein [Anaerolineae bacterium]